jgi:TonB-linked SusC/RagA family outer membrane protein
MKEKSKVKGLSKSLFKARHALKLSAMFLVMVFITQVTSVSNLLAQEGSKHKVTGKIVSATDNSPLPGVSIQVKGKSTGAITGDDGTFSIDVTDNDTLTVSFIGFNSENVAVAGKSEINVSLVENVKSLDEVVVIGYGAQKKKLLTGATFQVKGDQLQKSTTNAFTALQGQTPGMNITSTSGQPGSGFKVVVRGVGSIFGTSPLYIVDGVQTGDITYLNPSDIESIDVLKDAASAAIYGSQASNGVVIVTTKQGKAGRTQVTIDGYRGVQNVNNRIRTLNSKEYATIMNEQAVNSGKLPYFTNDQIDSMSTGTDWLREFMKDNVVTQNYVLGITGGNESSTYSSSLSYTQQGGVVGGKDWSNYERYGFRFNSEHKLYKNLIKFGQHLTFAYTNTNGIAIGGNYNNTLRSAFNADPFIPMYDKNGNFYNNSSDTWDNAISNPYASMVYNNQNLTNSQKLVGDMYMEITPIKNLTFKSSLGIEYNASKYHSYKPVYQLSIYDFNDSSTVVQNMSNNVGWIWDNTLSYFLKINEHQINVLAGMEAKRYDGTSINANNANSAFDGLDYAYLSNTTYKNGSLMGVGGGPTNSEMASYFGRVGYNYKETYMVNATFRADGSSNFAQGSRWGFFPSVSAGWTLSNESFMQNTKNLLNFLKLRASWGQVGNQNIDPYAYLAMVQTSNTNYIFGNKEGQLTPGEFPSTLANSKLKWESSVQTDIGLDAVVFNNLSVTFDWYNKTTKNWLVPSPLPATAGASALWINGGDVVNKGVELALTYNNKIGQVNYSIGANVAYNANKVKSIPTSDGIIHGETNQLWNNAPEFYRAQTGYPLGYFWGYKTLGVFQTEAEVQAYKDKSGNVIQPNAQPGDLKIADTNGDGAISSADKTNIGNPNPDYTFGFNVALNYKGFDFSVLANGVAGNQIVQSYRNQTDRFANYTTAIFDRWHGAGTSNKIPRLTEDGKNFTDFSDIYIQNGDFLRISNITLGYDFAKLMKLRAISQARLYFTVQNLITFTKYTGMDPELGYGNTISNGQVAQSNTLVHETFSYGVDYGYYPHPTTYLVGFNIKF